MTLVIYKMATIQWATVQSWTFLSGYTERERYNMLHSFPMVFCDGVEHLTQLFSAGSEYWWNWNPLASLFYFSKAEGSAMAEMKTWGPNFCTWPGHDPSQVSEFTSSFSWPWSKTHHPFSHTNQSLLLYCEHTQDWLVKMGPLSIWKTKYVKKKQKKNPK